MSKRVSCFPVQTICRLFTLGISASFMVCSLGRPVRGAEFLDLSTTLGDRDSYVNAISGDGTTVVGVSDQTTGRSWPTRWTFELGSPERLLLPIPTTSGQAWHVSSDGEWILGLYFNNSTPFIYSNATGVQRGPANSVSEGPTVISGDASVLAGGSYNDGGVLSRWLRDDQGQYQKEVLEIAGLMSANDISADGSVIIGYSGGERCDNTSLQTTCEAFRWTEASGLVGLGNLSGSGTPESRAFGVSSDGAVIVGGDDTQDGGWQSYRWTQDGGMQNLGMLAEQVHESRANAVSASGNIVVGTIGRPFETDLGAFIWTSEDGMRRVDDVLINDFGLRKQIAGWTLTSAVDVSDDGMTIVGGGINPAGNDAGWVAVLTPRPCDLNADRRCNAADIDLMYGIGNLVSGVPATPTNVRMDLTGDGVINRDDATQWLRLAANANKLATAYVPGDTNLDGVVNAIDLNSLALSWRNGGATWSGGDFTGEGTVDALDLNGLALNWRSIIPFEGTVLLKPNSDVYVQAFDEALGPDGTETGSKLPAGWSATDNGIEGDTVMQSFPIGATMPGSNQTTSTYNAGAENDPDRALAVGVRGTEDDLALQLHAHIAENDADSFQLQFDVEAWDALDGIRIGNQVFGGPDDPGEAAFKLTVDIDSGDGFTELVDLGTVTTGPILDPVFQGIVDGNADANRITFDSGVVSTSIPAGSQLRFRWAPDFNAQTDGWIFGLDNVSLHFFTDGGTAAAASVPEPSGLLLSVFGLAVMWLNRRAPRATG